MKRVNTYRFLIELCMLDNNPIKCLLPKRFLWGNQMVLSLVCILPKNNLDTQGYSTIKEMKYDFELICENAMVFNKPDTGVYKAAKRLKLSSSVPVTIDGFVIGTNQGSNTMDMSVDPGNSKGWFL